MSISHVLVNVFAYAVFAGLSVLWLLLLAKLLKEGRSSLPERRQKGIGLLVVLALFISSFAVMLITHWQNFTIAMLLIMAASLVNIFVTRMKTPHD